MRQEFTEISAKQWDYIAKENLTPKEAVAFLKSGMQLRTFSDNLHRLYQGQDLEKRLVQQMISYAEFENGEAKPDSIRKKVQNWMKNKNVPTDREEIFRIAFALGFDEEKTETLLLRTVEQGIHYRNEREVIYAFSLRNHQSYETAVKCAEAFAARKGNGGENQNPMTRALKLEFEQLPPGEDIINFLLKNRTRLGSFHNTAYQYFMKMLKILVGDGEEEIYSMEYIADHYLRLSMPEGRKTTAYSDIQKMIKKYWPGVKSIKAMKNRTEDVTRKVLMLLYIVIGGSWGDTYDELDEEYISAEELLEEHSKRLGRMLTDCGMSPVDPRNPFDYLILYCLKPDGDDFMSERMEQIVQELFAEESV